MVSGETCDQAARNGGVNKPFPPDFYRTSKMRKIIVKVPQKEKDKWAAYFVDDKGHHGMPVSKNSPTHLFNLILKRYSASRAKGQCHLIVKYGLNPDAREMLTGEPEPKWLANEGIYDKSKEFFFALASFLEDYLKPDFLKTQYRKYQT